MSKFDKMLEINKERSDEKISSALRAIRKLIEDKERITVPKLMHLTGLSKEFFYKNSVIRIEFEKAIEQQAGLIDPRRQIIDQAMEGRIVLLQEQLQKLKVENESLKKENQKLQKALNS